MTDHQRDRQHAIETLRNSINGMSAAMLCTRGGDGKLRGRPMTPARHEFDGDLWYFALDTSPPAVDVQSQPAVNVTYAAPPQRFVSLTGTASVVRDPQKLELLWKDELRGWFREGAKTPHLVLIRVAVEEAEYWEESSSAARSLSAMFSWKGSLSTVHERIHWPDDSLAEPPPLADESAPNEATLQSGPTLLDSEPATSRAASRAL